MHYAGYRHGPCYVLQVWLLGFRLASWRDAKDAYLQYVTILFLPELPNSTILIKIAELGSDKITDMCCGPNTWAHMVQRVALDIGAPDAHAASFAFDLQILLSQNAAW